MLLTGEKVRETEVILPNGETARFPIEGIRIEEGAVSCGVKKDSGDDPDITNGILVESRVERIRESAYSGGRRNRCGPGDKAGLKSAGGSLCHQPGSKRNDPAGTFRRRAGDRV